MGNTSFKLTYRCVVSVGCIGFASLGVICDEFYDLPGMFVCRVLCFVPVCGIMLLLRAMLNMLGRNPSPRGPMCFNYLIFSLSGPCELLCWLCFIASWT